MSMRKLFILFWALASACVLSAAPSLTTIQDILYKADGTRSHQARRNRSDAGASNDQADRTDQDRHA